MLEVHLPPPHRGRLNVTDPEIVPLGDVFTFREITYNYPGAANRPACEIVFQVRDGVPKCTKLVLRENDGYSIRTKDLVNIALEQMCRDFFVAIGIYRPAEDGKGFDHVMNSQTAKRDRRAVEKASARRKVTPELLKKVAEINNAAGPGGRIAAIRAAFDVSESQAKRYRKEAKKVPGLIHE